MDMDMDIDMDIDMDMDMNIDTHLSHRFQRLDSESLANNL